MQTDSPKIIMSAAETGFDDKIKPNLIEGAAAERIVKTAESYRRLIRQEAQTMANDGNLVVIVYESPDPHKPGHIAIIRPDARSLRLLEENGPSIIQAGQSNYTRTSAKVGFQHHPGAWPDGVHYYVHPVTF